MMALTPAMASVDLKPACKLKWPGSIPTAANPVMTPLAAPAMAAAARPLAHTSRRCMCHLPEKNVYWRALLLLLPAQGRRGRPRSHAAGVRPEALAMRRTGAFANLPIGGEVADGSLLRHMGGP